MVTQLLNAAGPTKGMGGTLVFPNKEGPWYFSGGISIGNDGMSPSTIVPSSILFRSSQQQRTNPTLLQIDQNAVFFTVDNNPGTGKDEQIGGISFQDLIISFNDPTEETIAGSGVGILVNSGTVNLDRVTLDECPDAGLWLKHSEHSSVIACNIRVEKVNNGTGIRLGSTGDNHQAIETYVTGTVFLAFNTNGTGVRIFGAEHLRMTNCRLEGWTNGIHITPDAGSGNVENAYFENISSYGNDTAVILNASGGAGGTPTFIAQVWFAQCEFGPGGGSNSSSGPGVLLDAIGDTNYNFIDQIRFVDCHSCLWNGPGMHIRSGTNIEILGGYYSCNGNSGAAPVLPYSASGIAISDQATNVRISNAACNNSLFNQYTKQMITSSSPDATQNWGVYIEGNVNRVQINGCSLAGNLDNGLWINTASPSPTNVYVKHCDLGSTPVKVAPVSIDNLQITDCPGYNDQNSSVATSGFTGNQHAAGQGYYGPSVVTWYNTGPTVVTLTLNSVNYTSNFGSVYLSPLDVIKFGPSAPTTIHWVGK